MSLPQSFVAGPTEGQTFTAGPFFIVSRVEGPQSNGIFELYELSLGAATIDYHVHDTMDETLTVLEGEIEFNVKGHKFLRPKGSVAYVPRGVHHGFTNLGPAKAKVLILFTPSRSQHEYFRELEKLFAAPTLDTAALTALQKKYDQALIKGE
ncbi:MAG: cupin domain-containing protein [Planctomycetes bacterium]|nr:cupin domain-containing protein [Planctomycetota bacterium]